MKKAIICYLWFGFIAIFFGAKDIQEFDKGVSATLELIQAEPGPSGGIWEIPVDLKLRISVCNKTSRRIFLARFESPSINIEILRADSLKKYIDYGSVFWSMVQAEGLAEFQRVGPKIRKSSIDSFADSTARAIFNHCRRAGNYDTAFLGSNSREILYQSLNWTRYLKQGECLVDTISLNGLKKFGGNFKIYVYRKNRKSNGGRAKPVTEYERFLEDIVPEKLKGYEKWNGVISSDTLRIAINYKW